MESTAKKKKKKKVQIPTKKQIAQEGTHLYRGRHAVECRLLSNKITIHKDKDPLAFQVGLQTQQISGVDGDRESVPKRVYVGKYLPRMRFCICTPDSHIRHELGEGRGEHAIQTTGEKKWGKVL